MRASDVELADGEAQKLNIRLNSGVVFRAKVVDNVSGASVAGVKLSNWQRPGVEGISGPDGTLEIRGLVPGACEFQVAAVGDARWWSEQCASAEGRFQPESSPGMHWQRNFDDLDFDLRGETPVTITVERGVRIRGRALDPDGKPVGGATVTAAHTGTGNSLTGDTRFSVETGTDGAFDLLLPASKEGEYNLEVHDGKYEEWRRWANGVLPPIRTQPGQEIDGMEIRLRRPAVIRGRAVNTAGEPVVGQTVYARADDKLENRYYDPQATTDQEGRFELRFVRPGRQTVFLISSREGTTPAKRAAERTIELPEGGTVDIELREDEMSSKAGATNRRLAVAVADDLDVEMRRTINNLVDGAWLGPFGTAKIDRWFASQPADWVGRVERDYPEGTAGLSWCELRELTREVQSMVGTPETGLNRGQPATWRFVLSSEQKPVLAEIARRASTLGFGVLAILRLSDIEELTQLPLEARSPVDADHPALGLELRRTELPRRKDFSRTN